MGHVLRGRYFMIGGFVQRIVQSHQFQEIIPLNPSNVEISFAKLNQTPIPSQISI